MDKFNDLPYNFVCHYVKRSTMSNTQKRNGHCLCGAVQITSLQVNHNMHACHCGACRNWGGGPLLCLDCNTDVSIQGKENVSTYHSSAWAERAFCKTCGTHLYYRLKHSNQYYIPVGLFSNTEDVIFDSQIYIDAKPAFYTFANQTKMLIETELLEMINGHQNN